MTADSGDDTIEPIDVPQPIRALLLAIVEGWVPDKFTQLPVETLHYGSLELSELSSTVALQHERLVTTLGGPRFPSRLQELLPFSSDRELAGTLSGGIHFEARDVASMRLRGHTDMVLEARDWTVLGAASPVLWVGDVQNAKEIAFGGNLVVEHIRDDGLRLGRRKHFRFSGVYTYYLLQTGDRAAPAWHLVLDIGDAPVNREVLEREFLILQFVLGRQLRVAHFIGVDAERHTRGAMSGVGSRSNLLTRSCPPVPLGRTAEAFIDDSWATVLFQRIASLCSAKSDACRPVAMALDSYLDSMTLHVDADYLRLQVALEAFAYWTLRLTGGEERSIIKDKAAWKHWLRVHRSAIQALAA